VNIVHGEEEEEGQDAVHLAPYRSNEKNDRVQQVQCRRSQPDTIPLPLEDAVQQICGGEIGGYRGQLQDVPELVPAELEDAVQAAYEPENVEVARRPVWEGLWRVEIPGPMLGELDAPELKRAQVDGETRQSSRDQPQQQADRQYDGDGTRRNGETYADGGTVYRFRIHGERLCSSLPVARRKPADLAGPPHGPVRNDEGRPTSVTQAI
jgi:hypothetical protein